MRGRGAQANQAYHNLSNETKGRGKTWEGGREDEDETQKEM